MIETTDDVTYPHIVRTAKGPQDQPGGGIAARPDAPLPSSEKQTTAHPIYPTLPGDASRFTYSQQVLVDNGGVPIVKAQYKIFEEEVPKGYVLYVKEYRAYIQSCFSTINPILSGIPNVNTLVTLQNRDSPDQFNQNLLTEPLPGWNDCFLIAGENAVVVVTMKVDFSIMPVKPTNLQILTYIRGDALARNTLNTPYTALMERA